MGIEADQPLAKEISKIVILRLVFKTYHILVGILIDFDGTNLLL